MHIRQQQRLNEIDALIYECQRHNLPAVTISYAQLRALRDGVLMTKHLLADVENLNDPSLEPAIAFLRGRLADNTATR